MLFLLPLSLSSSSSLLICCELEKQNMKLIWARIETRLAWKTKSVISEVVPIFVLGESELIRSLVSCLQIKAKGLCSVQEQQCYSATVPCQCYSLRPKTKQWRYFLFGPRIIFIRIFNESDYHFILTIFSQLSDSWCQNFRLWPQLSKYNIQASIIQLEITHTELQLTILTTYIIKTTGISTKCHLAITQMGHSWNFEKLEKLSQADSFFPGKFHFCRNLELEIYQSNNFVKKSSFWLEKKKVIFFSQRNSKHDCPVMGSARWKKVLFKFDCVLVRMAETLKVWFTRYKIQSKIFVWLAFLAC